MAADSAKTLQRSALVVATTASFLTPFLGSAVIVALPIIGVELAMSPVQLSWVTTAFVLASAVCLVPFGRAADLVGRKRVFLAGMLLFSAASLACGLAWNGAALIAFRAVQGAGGAMIFGTGLAILTTVYPPAARGRAIGLNSAAVYLGLSVGPFVGGILTRLWGWQSVFFVSVPLGLVAAAVAARGLQGEWKGSAGGRFDAVGSAIYAGALLATMLGLSSLPQARGFGLVAAGGLALVVFIGWERRVASPVLDVALLAGNAVFARSNLAALINYSATYAVTFLLSLYLQYVRGLDPSRAGVVLVTQSVVMATVSPFAGRLSDRVEPRIVASIGMMLTVAGLAWLVFLQAATPLGAIVAALVVLGAGFGLFSSPNTNAVMSAVARNQFGIASATLGTMRLLGQMVSMGLAAAVIAWYVGDAAITPGLHGRFIASLRMAFLISAVGCVVGVFVSLTRGDVRPGTAGGRREP